MKSDNFQLFFLAHNYLNPFTDCHTHLYPGTCNCQSFHGGTASIFAFGDLRSNFTGEDSQLVVSKKEVLLASGWNPC